MQDPLKRVMTFGKFKGKTYREILNGKDGVEYIRWMANDVNFNNQEAKQAAKEALRAARL